MSRRGSVFRDWWPEMCAVAGCLFVFAVLHLDPMPGLISTALLYGGLRWAAHLGGRQASQVPATIEDLLAEIDKLSGNARLAPFRQDLGQLAGRVRREELAAPGQDPGLREFTRATLETVASNSRDIARLAWVPTADQAVFIQFRTLIAEAGQQLDRSFAAAKEKDSAVLAQQIDQSTEALRNLQQQIMNGG